jgi:AcrR family transcriptional regulator
MADLRAEVVEKAMDFLNREGISKLSLRRIATELGVTHQAPYHHFKSKSDLVSEIQLRAYRTLNEKFDEVMMSEDDPFRAFQRLGIEYIWHCVRTPAFFRSMSSMIPPTQAVVSEMKRCDSLIETIARRACQASGREVSVKNLRVTCWSSAHGFAALYLGGQIKVPKKALGPFVEENTRFLVDLIR